MRREGGNHAAQGEMTFVSRGLKLYETEIRVCEYQNIVHSHSNL